MDCAASESCTEPQRLRQHGLRPCVNCRDRHLRCDYETEVCKRCQKDGKACSRLHPRYKFRRSRKHKSQNCFSEDQPWMRTASSLEYVDETRELIAAHNHSDNSNAEEASAEKIPALSGSDSQLLRAVSHEIDPASVERGLYPLQDDQISSQLGEEGSIANLEAESIQQAVSGNGPPATEPLSSRYPQIPQAVSVVEDCSSFGRTRHNYDRASGSVECLFSDLQRAVLLRYFVQELAPWFDICDPERHFGQVVPRRARSSEALLNAICTVSARSLFRLQRYRNSEGKIEWNGIQLPHVTQDTAVEYHNECIRDLLRFSLDPEELQNVDLLAASVVLRSDEEMDMSSQGLKINNEVFLQVTGVFMDAQTPSVAAVPYISPSLYQAMTTTESESESLVAPGGYSPLTEGDSAVGTQDAHPAAYHNPIPPFVPSQNPHSEGLRQACFWIALRQELYASFVDQRPFKFELSKFDSFRNLSRASDAVWADRVIVFHAAVLEFCYNLPANGMQSVARWQELHQESQSLAQRLPMSFRPMHIGDRASGSGQMFPEVWYLENCHVTAAAYLELTKILLVSFNPGRPKFGTGYLANQRAVTETSKQACTNLCGMALSNQQAPPIHLCACAAVGLCGEYFHDSGEREALIWFLEATERSLGYSTAELISTLTEAWNGS